jgi:hypothetical protein
MQGGLDGKPIVKKATPSGSKYRVPAAPVTGPEIPSDKRISRSYVEKM